MTDFNPEYSDVGVHSPESFGFSNTDEDMKSWNSLVSEKVIDSRIENLRESGYSESQIREFIYFDDLG